MTAGSTGLVALLGRPVAESLSPRLQNAAFAARGLEWRYVACEVEPDRLADAVRGLNALGFAGANVTIPHKQTVLELCDELDAVAARAGSVNTLNFRANRVLGSSTDAEALGDRMPARAAVIGAGGAAAAWIEALERRGADVRVFSRQGDWPPDTAAAEVVVHATPLRDELLFQPHGGQTVIDLAYRANGEPTALAAAARAAGCDVMDGLEVLVGQGAASFVLWTGVPAPVEVMRAAVGLRP